MWSRHAGYRFSVRQGTMSVEGCLLLFVYMFNASIYAGGGVEMGCGRKHHLGMCNSIIHSVLILGRHILSGLAINLCCFIK